MCNSPAEQIITASVLRYKSYIQHKMDLRHQKTGGREIPLTRKSSKRESCPLHQAALNS